VMGGSCAVLLYHRVTQLETDPQLLSVTPENFDIQLSYLKKNHVVLLIDELKYHLENKKKLPARSVAMTFDDGYADNYCEALPILEKHQLQALFYIATGTLNTPNEFWWDAVERIVLLSENEPLQDQLILNEKPFDFKNLNHTKRKLIYDALLPQFRKMLSSKREKKINELSTIFDSIVPRASHRAMTFDELKKMSDSKSVIVGAHTHLHPSLAALSYNEQLNEIKASKEILENKLQQNIVHFSFPFGTINDFNADTLKICNQLNFEMVAANIPYITHSGTDKMQFPRFLVRNWNATQFKSALNSFFA
jgi:peptidoglycan/xylan/chitin deacetylase (PgdA/CDA1 family)